jgi:RNA polymerase sigma-70 factor, ECF subfamily
MAGQHEDEQIVQLISSCQRSLLMYLLGLLGSQDLAEDALQNTNLVLWRKRSEFRLNTNFFAWACRIANFEACDLRKRRRRKVPVFSDVFIAEVADELEAAVETPNTLEAFLKECVQLLDDRDRELLDQRYADGATTQSVASALEQSARSVYRSLERIHERLFQCVSEKAKQDGVAL